MSDKEELLYLAEVQEALLSAAEAGRWSGLSAELVLHYFAHGLIEAARVEQEPLFAVETVGRLRKIQRLRTQLGINLPGIAVVLDLLERLEELQAAMRLRTR